MYTDACKKENDTNDRLIIALERNDVLQYELSKMRQELLEFQLLD